MAFEEDVLHVVDLAYAAAEEPAGWSSFLIELASLLQGTATGLVFENVSARTASVNAFVNVDPAQVVRLQEYYAALNPWVATGPPKADVMTGEMILPDAELVRTEYYNDFLRKMDTHYLLVAVPILEASSFTHLSVLRPSRVGPYDEESVRLLQAVVPHLRRALRIHQRLVATDLKAKAASDALDRMRMGVILLGERGTLVGVNRAAREILGESDGLWMDRGELTAATGVATNALRRFIANAIAKRAQLVAVCGGALLLPRRSGRRPLEASVVPTHIAALDEGRGAACAIVFVVDPELELAAGESLLSDLHGLSRAEARLARLLASGRTLTEAAAEMGISLNTVRTQLKALFRKTETARQTDLVSLLHLGLAGTVLL